MNDLLIRADATTEMGTGHVMRCLALAQAWQGHGGKATFLSHCEGTALRQRILNEGFDFIPLETMHPHRRDVDQTITILEQLAIQNLESKPWIAADGYHFDTEYQKIIKERGYKLLWIDDYGHADHYYADIVLNQNISADALFYIDRETYTQLLLGPKFIMLRREFLSFSKSRRDIPPVASKVLVTMGGSDPCNSTVKVLQALQKVEIEALEVAIIIGPANPHTTQIEEEMSHCSFTVYCLPAVWDMRQQMVWADIAVSAGGSTCWELAYMELPNIIIVSADNQIPIAEGVDAAGAAINLGWHDQVSTDRISEAVHGLLSSEITRNKVCKIGRSLVDGLGLKRLMSVCEAIT